MFANEPCADDEVPKIARTMSMVMAKSVLLDAVFEAAERDYQFDDSIDPNFATEIGKDNRIHMFPDDGIDFDLGNSSAEDIDTVQWRSNHLRDDWSVIQNYEKYSETGTLTAIDIINQLEHLPGISIEGNHTISLRRIEV